jgi:membrane fusion protein (multidrug efflux system)
LPKSRFLAVFTLLAPGLVGLSCGNPGAGGAAAKAAVPANVVDVVLVRPALDPHDVFLTFLEPAVDAPVIARSDGIVQDVLVREGQRVGRGQALARLDSEEQRLEIDYVGALAAQAKAELERAEKGASSQVVSRQSLDAARAKAAATKADLELAKLALERRTLRAPVAGIVWQVRAEPHRPVKTSDVLFRVTEPGRLKADLYLPATLKNRVHAGDRVTLIASSDAGAPPVTGRITLVSPIVDPATARFRTQIETVGASEALAGSNVRVRLASGDSSTVDGGEGALLSRGALLEREGDGLYVWRIAGGKAERVRIELGASRPDGYEVLAGLAPGDLVRAQGTPAPSQATALVPRLRDH